MNSLTRDNVFSKEENLIYNILFGKNNHINIQMDEFCIYKNREKFKNKIRTIVKRGGVKIIDDRILHNEETLIWKIEVTR